MRGGVNFLHVMIQQHFPCEMSKNNLNYFYYAETVKINCQKTKIPPPPKKNKTVFNCLPFLCWKLSVFT